VVCWGVIIVVRTFEVTVASLAVRCCNDAVARQSASAAVIAWCSKLAQMNAAAALRSDSPAPEQNSLMGENVM